MSLSTGEDSQPPLVVAKDAEIILPPPSPVNPVPILPAALRVDNQDQLVQFLQSDPHAPGSEVAAIAGMTGGNASSSLRQLLVFGNESLRTLLLRQVLSDPHRRTFKAKKKNWDPIDSFPFPAGLNIVGTRVLSSASAEVKVSTNPFDVQEKEAIDVVTYFLRPTECHQTVQASQFIRSSKSMNMRTTHHRIVYLPQPTAMIQKVLKNLGLTAAPNVSIHRLQLDVFPLESDILSLEYNCALHELEVQGMASNAITTVARSILKLQDVVKKIPRIQAYGPIGEEVLRKLLNMTVDEYLAARDQPEPDDAGPVVGGSVAALILMDRKVDLVTPLVTPLTYEGLLDDVVGIDCGFISVDVNIINPDDDESEKKDDESNKNKKSAELAALGVNGSDSLYAEVRNQHVEKFGSFLQNQAMALRESHANFTSQGKKKDLAEIHQFVKQIPVFTQNLRSLTNHIHLAELVKKTSEEAMFRERWQLERSIVEGETCYEQLEDLVASQYQPFRFLSLLCLQSVCAAGIKSSRYDALRRDVVQTYGYEYLFVLQNLEKAGLLRRREGLWIDSASPFNSLRKSLSLINPEVDTVDPDDISYVSSGYAPLSVRLIQTAVKGWKGRDDILRELPGRMIDIVQQNPPEDLQAAMKRPSTSSLGDVASVPVEGSKKPVMIVLYVGGVTWMEIAALRYLSKRPSFPFHIICCTTSIINGTDMLKSLSQP